METEIIALVDDGSLVVEGSGKTIAAIASWIPRRRLELSTRATDASVISVEAGMPQVELDVPDETLLRLGSVRAATTPDGVLLTTDGIPIGSVAIDAGAATVFISDTGLDPFPPWRYALTIAAALLLARRERALVHAAAVADKAGRAWLLVGDSHSGKTTTAASLVKHGWGYLADDHVVLHRSAGETIVEGWPRQPHVDTGWAKGIIHGARERVDLFEQWPDRFVRKAPLGGILLTAIDGPSTRIAGRVRPAAALTALVRQSPWVMAAGGYARQALAVLELAVVEQAYSLSLGPDTYADGRALDAVISGGIGATRAAGGIVT